MRKSKRKQLKKILGVSLVIITATLFAFWLQWFVHHINYVYPFRTAADRVLFISDDSAEPPKRMTNVGFVLGDIATLAEQNIETDTVEYNGINADKRLSALADVFTDIYFGLFSQKDNPATAIRNSIGRDLQATVKQYINDETSVRMRYTDNHIELQTSGQSFTVNNEAVSGTDTPIITIPDVSPDDIARINETFVGAQDEISLNLFDVTSKPIEIYKPVTTTNLLAGYNPSFEQGLWSDEPFDCSTNKKGNAIDISISGNAPDGSAALLLRSHPGRSCTNKTFPVHMDDAHIYALSFDYQIASGDSAQYFYRIENDAGDRYEYTDMIPRSDGSWHTFRKIIDTEQVQDITSFNVHFYAPAYGDAESIVLYDNVRLLPYTMTKSLDLSAQSFDDLTIADPILVTAGENNVSYTVKAQNMLDERIASFGEGLWKDEIWDCTPNKEGNIIDMRLLPQYEAKKTVLELSSKPGNACTNYDFTVALDQSRQYKLSFDYYNETGEQIQYYYRLSGITSLPQTFSERVNVESGKWNTFETIIDPEIPGITKMNIHLYAPALGASGETVNLYDNVRLTEWLPKDLDSYYLYAENKTKNTARESDVSADFNAVRYEVGIDSDSSIANSKSLSSTVEPVSGFASPKSGLPMPTQHYATGSNALYQNNLENEQILRQAQDDEVIVEWKPINRWKNRVVLHGVTDSFLLVYPAKFSDMWGAYVSKLKTQSSKLKTESIQKRWMRYFFGNSGVLKYAPTKELGDTSKGHMPYATTKALEGYTVDERNKNRQATREEVGQFMRDGLISKIGTGFISKNFDGSIRNDNLSNGWSFETLFKRSIPDELHYQVNNWGNAWWVDMDEICSAQTTCIRNTDGSYDIVLMVEHTALRYVYAFVITAITASLAYFFLPWTKRKQPKKRRKRRS